MDVLQASFAGGEISPALHGRVDLSKYSTSLARALNCQITAEGSVTTRPGLEWVGEVADASQYMARQVPFQFNNEQTYQLEFSHQKMRVIMDGALVLAGAAKTVTAVTAASPGVFTAAAHGYSVNDEVYLSGITTMPSVSDTTYFVQSVTTNTFTLRDRFGNVVSTMGLTAFSGAGAVQEVYQIATPYPSTALRRIKFVQSADTMWLCHPDYAVRKLTRTGHASWSMTSESFGPSISAPTGLAATHTGGTGTATTNTYAVTAVNAQGEESVVSATVGVSAPSPDTWPAGAYTALSWTPVAGTERYRIYKREVGILGFIGSSQQAAFWDRNITPDVGQTPPIGQTPFSGSGEYPACAAFFEQRLIYGGAENNPATLVGSKTAAFSNFNYSRPALATDALEFSLVSRKVNSIVSLVPLDNLVALTTDAEFVIRGAGDGDFLSASNPGRPKAQTYYGAADMDALVIGSSGLFVQADGQTIRDMGYDFIRNSYDGADLSILARHLMDGKQVVSWAYAQYPDSLVYVVFDDGSAACFSYIREGQDRAVAWAPMVTDGTFEDVSVIREGQRDVPYFIVKRTINGSEKRYIERLASRDFDDIEDAFFVDCGRSYSGAATSTFYGLGHLVGATVSVLADGDVFTGIEVRADGSIELPKAAAKVHVGLPYVSETETLPVVNLQVASGGPGRRKNLLRLVLRVLRSRGIKVGRTGQELVEHKERNAPFDEAIQPITGFVDVSIPPKWDRNSGIVIRQEYPLPMTIQGILAEVRAEDG